MLSGSFDYYKTSTLTGSQPFAWHALLVPHEEVHFCKDGPENCWENVVQLLTGHIISFLLSQLTDNIFLSQQTFISSCCADFFFYLEKKAAIAESVKMLYTIAFLRNLYMYVIHPTPSRNNFTHKWSISIKRKCVLEMTELWIWWEGERLYKTAIWRPFTLTHPSSLTGFCLRVRSRDCLSSANCTFCFLSIIL